MKSIGNRALFFDLSLDLHCIASPDAKFLHINKRWEQVLGFTEAELKAGSFLDLVHPEDIEKTLAAMEQLNQGLEVAKFSNRYRTKDAAYRVFDWNALYDPDHQLYYATARDVTEERVAAERSVATNRMLSAINHARDLYLSQGMNAEWWDQMLGDVLALTGSEYGFIGAIEEDEEGRYLRTFAITDISWDTATRDFFLSGREEGLVFRNLKTLFGEVIVTQEHVIANEVASDPRAAGRPPGHPPLNRFLGLALHGVGEMVGMIGVANRHEPYDHALIEHLHPVTNFLGTLIESQGRKVREQNVGKQFHELQELNSLILEASTSFIFALDPQGTCISANKAVREVFGVGEGVEETEKISLERFRRDETWFRQQMARVGTEGRAVLELEVQRITGDLLQCEFTLTALRDAQGKLKGLLFVGLDLTMRKKLEAGAVERAALISRVDAMRKRQSEDELVSGCVDYLLNCNSLAESHQIVYRHLAELYQGAEVEVSVVDSESDDLVKRWPAPAEQRTSFSASDCWGMRSRRLHVWWRGSSKMRCRHDEDAEADMVVCAPLRSYESTFGLISVRFSDLATLPEEEIVRVGETRMKRFGEISQRISVALATVELKVRLEEAALTDPLTEVNNRRAFEQHIHRCLGRSRRTEEAFAVLLLDIDFFKNVNDELGHDVGDQVLRDLAAKLRECTRVSDSVGRLGGEEFGVLLEGVSKEQALVKAEELRSAIEKEIRAASRPVTASFGVVHSSMYERPTWKLLYGGADKALYQAKEDGRNQVRCAWSE